MNFSKKKKKDFETRFTSGFNKGNQLINRIPLHLQESAQFTLHALQQEQPKNIELQGVLSGFTHAIQQVKAKRMAEYIAINKGQTKQSQKER